MVQPKNRRIVTESALELFFNTHAASTYTPSDQIATLCDFGIGQRVWAVAGDSTANHLVDWVGTFLYLLKPELSDAIGIQHRTFEPTTQEWQTPPTNVKQGTTIPEQGGLVMNDTFSRSGEIVGSTADNGATWLGKVGAWAGNGTRAIPASTGGPISFDAGSTNVALTTELVITTDATDRTGNSYVRLEIGADDPLIAHQGVFTDLSVNSSGFASLSVWKRFGGVNTQIGSTDFATGLVGKSSTPQAMTLKIETSIQNVKVTCTVGSTVKSVPFTITETESSAMGDIVFITTSGDASKTVAMDSVKIETPYTPETYAGLSVWNGAVGGATLAYQQSRLASMYGGIPVIDVMIVSGGHNYGTKTGAQFVAEVESFVNAYKALHPESLILISSQNPEKAPASYITAHAVRQAALREWALSKGYEYIPAFETFTAQADGGVALIQADGIHPTVPPNYTTEPSGSTLWARVFMNMVNSRRIVGQPQTTTP